MHNHSHSADSCAHGHSHHSHSHHPHRIEKTRLLWIALLLIGGFALAELAVGLWSHSLALLAESEHMISDALSLGLALMATWMTQSWRRRQHTQVEPQENGWLEVVAALVNSLGLVAIALWIAREAMLRLQAPAVEILSVPMLITALLGLVVNTINILLLHQDSQHDLNLKGAFLHIVADAISSVGVIIAAIAVWRFHWLWADGAISLFVAGLIIVGAIPLILQSSTLLFKQSIVLKKS